ncbi:hypothetical protein GCM10020369_79210 [Cryptosporangium minutisporangium]|uniref:Putative restriction endonuclease domain-containing protein n=2 Tax=Cryptosporangium minutisporangium TaxID=113569 RepID=A0ABP6TC44_9ACTN
MWDASRYPEGSLADTPVSTVTGMTAAVGLYEPPDGWSDDELVQVPEGVHYEIEDGRLVVSPRPTFWHQEACRRLTNVLEEQCPSQYWPVQEGEVRIYDGRVVAELRAPDILVVPRELTRRGAYRGWAHPHEVSLAAEVVSRHSYTPDRTTKVSVYAAWGIPLYLRLETEPEVVLYAYRLGSNKTYEKPTEHRELFTIEEPFQIQIDPALWT